MDARELLHGLTPARIAELAHVSIHTARRWKRCGRMPRQAHQLLQLSIAGELGTLAKAWLGWSLRDGKLVSPEGWHVSPGEIRAIPYRVAQLRALERELEQPQQRSLQLS